MNTLLKPVRVGDLELPNRVVMAPLTRSRAGESRVPNELMARYYAQRASAGLVITEATSIVPQGVGYAATPGIWSEAQVEGWKGVTEAVHAKDGRIVLQLWHVGRVSDPEFLYGGLPVAPSALAESSEYVTPRALETREIPLIVDAYATAAKNAKRAGFDGVMVHGANGYLLDQFLQSGTNLRTDEYGGPIENRARFLLAAVDAAVSVWGAGRVAANLAPRSDSHGMSDANPRETFGYVARELGRRKLAFLFLRESQGPGYQTPTLKEHFGGPVVANQGLDFDSASRLIDDGQADLASFGKLFIANPDLVDRLRTGAPLNAPDPSTFYGGGAKGYVDYPIFSGFERTLEPQSLQA
jgi:NADPH2 dehydrogenase